MRAVAIALAAGTVISDLAWNCGSQPVRLYSELLSWKLRARDVPFEPRASALRRRSLKLALDILVQLSPGRCDGREDWRRAFRRARWRGWKEWAVQPVN